MVDVKDEQQTLVIQRGLTLHGRVVHEGAGLAGVRVRVSQVHEAGLPMYDAVIVTDAIGAFVTERIHSFSGEPGFTPTAFVRIEDDAWQSARYIVNEEAGGRLPDVDVRAEPKDESRPIQTRVVGVSQEEEPGPADVPGGNSAVHVTSPVATDLPADWLANSGGIELRGYADRTANVRRKGWLDDSRTCLFDHLPAGKYVITCLTVASPNFVPAIVEMQENEVLEHPLALGPCSLKVALSPRSALLDSMQFTLQGRGVQISPWGFNAHPSVEPDGGLLFTGLTPGNYELSGSAHRSLGVRKSLTLDEGLTEIAIEVPTGSIHGDVGSLHPTTDYERRAVSLSRAGGAGEEQIRELLDVDAEGRFGCEMLPFGTYEIHAEDADGGLCTSRITLDANSPSSEVHLSRREGRAKIAGKIRFPDSFVTKRSAPSGLSIDLVPIEDGQVVFDMRRRGDLYVREGTYSFEGVAAGRYGLLVTAPSGTATTWSASFDVAGEDSLEGPALEVSLGRSVKFQPSTPGSGEITSWSLQMPGGESLPSAAFQRRRSFDETLWYEPLTLAAGRYAIVLRGRDGRDVSQAFVVEDGQDPVLITVPVP
jgi:hypothetical protein